MRVPLQNCFTGTNSRPGFSEPSAPPHPQHDSSISPLQFRRNSTPVERRQGRPGAHPVRFQVQPFSRVSTRHQHGVLCRTGAMPTPFFLEQ
jgi:hypothetical protein